MIFKSLEHFEQTVPLIAPPLTVCSYHTKHALEELHPNIVVFRHPDHLPDTQTLQSSFMSSLQNFKLTAASAGQLPHDALKALYGVNEDTVLYWAHHEKLCIIDGRIAFMGGIDLCFGRWDTNQHSIADVHPGDMNRVVFPGQDYNNSRIMDFQDVTHWQNNKLDRTQEPRMGWTDLSISLTGPVVDDLREHFVQRWNFIYYEKYDVRKDARYKPLPWIAPPGIPQSSYPHPKQSQPGQQPQPNQPLPGQTQPIQGYGGTQQSTSFPPAPTQTSQTSYQGAALGAPSGVSSQSGQVYPTPPGQTTQTSYQGATPGAVPSQSGQLYPTPLGQTGAPSQGPSGYVQGGYQPAPGQTGAGATISGQGTGYTQGNDQYYPPPPSSGPQTGQTQQSYGSTPQTQGTQPYNTAPGTQSNQSYGPVPQTQGTQPYGTTPGAQSNQPYGSPAPTQGTQQSHSSAPGIQGNPAYGTAPSQSNPTYFPPPPGQATRGIDDEDYGEEGERGVDDQYEDERAFSGRQGGRSGSGRFRDELRQRFDSGLQQLDSRYGSKIQSGLQRLDNRLGTHAGSQYAGMQGQVTVPRGIGVSCQIVRSCARWSNGVALEHSIANAYIDVIRRSQHFIYIENQFFITATNDKQMPVKNKIAAAIVERVLRAARQGQKYKIIVVIPAIPGFAGDLRSDDALSTRAIMEFQYNSISRGGYSIYQSLAREGVNPVDYVRFYNLRNYDRINASLAMREAEARSGVAYGAAQTQYDARYGGGFPGDASRAIDPQGAGAETTRGLEDTSGGYEQPRAYGANQDIYGAAAAQGQGQAPGANDSTWSLYAPPNTSQPPASGQTQSYAPYHPPQTSTSGPVSPPPPNPDGSYSAYRPPTLASTGPVSPATPATAGGSASTQNYGSQPTQPPPSGYDSQSTTQDYGRPQTPGQQQSGTQPIAELSGTNSPQTHRVASGVEGGVQQTATGYTPATPYSQGASAQQPYTQQQPSQTQGYDQQQQAQTQGYGQQPSAQPSSYSQTPPQTTQTGYSQPPSTQPQDYGQSALAQAQAYDQQQSAQQTGYAQQQQPTQQAGHGQQPQVAATAAGQYQQGDAYQQYQAGAQQIGDHQGLGTSGRWDSVAECYMLNGEDIRKVPWEQGGMPEIDAFVTEELYIHSKVKFSDAILREDSCT